MNANAFWDQESTPNISTTPGERLYGFLRIPPEAESDGPEDLFKVGRPDEQSITLILDRRSYTDEILIPTESWDALCTKVERSLDVCD